MAFGLQIKAELENLTKFQPINESFNWSVKFKCSQCGTMTDFMTLDPTIKLNTCDKITNFSYKCRSCKSQCHVEVITRHASSYDIDDSGKWKTIIGFFCRGLIPEFHQFLNNWSARSLGTDELYEIDFSKCKEGQEEFCDVDKDNNSVTIYSIESQFIHLKEK